MNICRDDLAMATTCAPQRYIPNRQANNNKSRTLTVKLTYKTNIQKLIGKTKSGDRKSNKKSKNSAKIMKKAEIMKKMKYFLPKMETF